jgi:hypothetical protein
MTDEDLDRLAGWNRLEAFRLSLAAGIREDWPWLGGLPNLRYLEVSANEPVGKQALARLGEMKNLTALSLDAGAYDDNAVDGKDLVFLSSSKRLENLDVSIHKDYIAAWDAVVRNPGWRRLRISTKGHKNKERTDISLGALKRLAAMTNLESLSIGGKSDPDFSILAAAPCLKELSWSWELSLTDQELTDLASIKGLTRMDLWWCHYTELGLAKLAAMPALEELGLYYIDFNENDLACLADFPALTKLTLDFQGNGNLPLKRFDFLKSCRNLTRLTINERGEWSEAMLKDIADAKGLKVLSLSALWDLSGEWLAHLKRLPALEEFRMHHCLGIRNRDIAFLAEMKSLKRIYFDCCDKLTVKGLLAMRDLPLEKVEVSGLRHFTPLSEREVLSIRRTWPEAEGP